MLSRKLVSLRIVVIVCIVLVRSAVQSVLPKTTFSGYLSTNKSDGSELFFAYYEAQDAADRDATGRAPVLLWLQVCDANIEVRQTAVGRQNDCVSCFTGWPRMCQHVWQHV